MFRRRLFASVPVLLLVAPLASFTARAEVCTALAGGPGDLDGDGFVAAADCDDGNPDLWARAGEVTGLHVPLGTPDVFAWDAPVDLGYCSKHSKVWIFSSAE